jgi:hypothetical protein
MPPEELRSALRTNPFQPFRLVMTDGTAYEIRHPDLLWVGARVAMVGFPTGDSTLFDRHITVALLHVQRIEPIGSTQPTSGNGAASA